MKVQLKRAYYRAVWTLLLYCGCFTGWADAQAVDQSVNASVDSSPDRSVMHSVNADSGEASRMNAGANSQAKGAFTSTKASPRIGGQNALGFQVSTLDSGKVKYFGYTLGGSSEMSSAGELTVSSREKSIAARERANQKAGSAASAPSLTSSSQLHIAVARTYISGSKVASPAGQAESAPDQGRHSVLAIVVSPENGPAMLKIPLSKTAGPSPMWSRPYLADSPFVGPKPLTANVKSWTTGFVEGQHAFPLNHGKRPVASSAKRSSKAPGTPTPDNVPSLKTFSNPAFQGFTTVR